jgi:transposase
VNKPELVEVSQEQIDELLALTKGTLPSEKYRLLEAVLGTFVYVMQALQRAKTSLRRFKRMLFGATTESKGNLLKPGSALARRSPQQPPAATAAPSDRDDAREAAALESSAAASSSRHTGHGRNGAQAYAGATVITMEHPSLKSGDRCPQCQGGKVYTYEPRRLVRWIGQAPLAPTVYHIERLRCRMCDSLFSAPLPAGIDERHYDESSAAMIALLKYGTGMPWYRLQGLQANLQLPLPDATQWEIVERAAQAPRWVFEELIRQAAQSPLLHNDDTPTKIVELMKSAKLSAQEGEPAQARAVNTSCIVAPLDTHKVVLYFTGPKHAGENLARVLAHRAQQLAAPIQMCDALSRNYPKDFATLIANCLTHARRNFVDVMEFFPEPCSYVIELLAEIYRHDSYCKEHTLSPEQRLAYHQSHSGPRMEELKTWMDTQFDERLVEPNSGLGKAIKYMHKRWNKFTLFLRQAGAPLDNNLCERSLKKAILHRKGSLYYRTVRGAEVGDIYMSLIATCEHCEVNAFEYLKALQRQAVRVREHPHLWLPWNYHEQLADTL